MSLTVAELKNAFAGALPADLLAGLDPARPLTEQGVDSLAITIMAVALQKTFGITLSAEDGLQLKTLNDVVSFLNARKG